MSWTEEKVAKLKELWSKGHTASQIAEALGDTTRNAVIGKAHRLNLEARAPSKQSNSPRTNDNKQMKDVWNFTAPKKSEKSFGKHPTQKPLELLTRILLSTTNENDLVLDPFNGSGTTGVACAINKRRYIGIELERKYIELAKKRINEIEMQLNL